MLEEWDQRALPFSAFAFFAAKSIVTAANYGKHHKRRRRHGGHAPQHGRNSHALGDPSSGSFRFGHPDCASMLRGFRIKSMIKVSPGRHE